MLIIFVCFFRNIAFRQSISFNIIVTAPFGLDGSGQCMGNDFVELYKDLSRTTSGLFFQLCQTFAVGSVRDVSFYVITLTCYFV